MRHFLTLTKAQLISGLLSKSANMKKWVILLVVFLAFLPLFGMTGYAMYYLGVGAKEVNAVSGVVSACMTIVQFAALIVGTISLLSLVYFSTDNEILLALPIRPHTIFLSKLFVVYINELLFVGFFALSVFVPLGIGAGVGAVYYILLPLLIVLLPVLPLLAASIISVPLMYALSFFRRRAALASFVAVFLLSALLAVYMFFSSSMGRGAEEVTDFAELFRQLALKMSDVGQKIYPNFVFASAIFGTFWEIVSGFVLGKSLLFALLILTVAIASLCYNRSIALMESPKSQKTKQAEWKNDKSILHTLVKKDFLEIIKNPAIAIHCLLQVVLMPVISLIFIINISEIEMLESRILILSYATTQVFMVIALSITSATSITRENRNFFMMKVIPVGFETQIKAKVIIGSLFCTVSLLLSNLVFLFFMSSLLEVIYLVLSMVFLIVLGYGFNMKMVDLDLRRPRLNWQTVTEGLKNNSAQLIGLVYSLLFMVVIFVVGIGFYALYIIFETEVAIFAMWLILILGAVGTVRLFSKSLYKNIEQKFENIEE